MERVLRWYFRAVYGVTEGPGTLPFYCDGEKVGYFAVRPEKLANGDERELYRLFVAQAMFQARRDVVIQAQQRSMTKGSVWKLSSAIKIRRQVAQSECPRLASAKEFDEGCTVYKRGGIVDCSDRPSEGCHVKDATLLFNRMGDMGKLPTSALLHLWSGGGLNNLRTEALAMAAPPMDRAEHLVRGFSRVYRVGRKLATMYVSTLTVPWLSPGLAPWFPDFDGRDLVVVDTNVARAVSLLSENGSAGSYDWKVGWLRQAASEIALENYHPDVPQHSARILQQALYSFCSRANRKARKDPCVTEIGECDGCVPALCPFAVRM